MSTWKTIFLFTFLVLALILQLGVLHWSFETVFFVTWFLVMLVVKHDTRLSPALGLVFLASCPFLLIASKDPVAEQAANYAYFFLAIGVLVQAEEMILERSDRLGWKVDLSFILPRADQQGKKPDLETNFQTSTNSGITNLQRWVLIISVVGLAIMYLLADMSGVARSTLLPLMGGSILFLFFVLGLRLVLLAFAQTRLAQTAWLLLLLPPILIGGYWVNEMIDSFRIARMEVAYDFISQLGNASRSLEAGQGEVVEAQIWTIDGESQQVLFQHPALSGISQISFPVTIEPGTRLAFDVATSPESWDRPGDGVTFIVHIENEAGKQQVFSTYIDPKQDEFNRRWHPFTIDLGEYAGQEVSILFETGAGPAGDIRYDWAGWGNLRLLTPKPGN